MLVMLAVRTAGAQTGGVTFVRDVLPILQKRCQTCHRPGEAGSGSFLTYESTRPWAQAIKAAVLTRKMPPWFASPEFGHFLNERRLTDPEIRTLVSWVDAGAPQGDAGSKPARVKWTTGWNIQPDVVFTTPRPYVVPAQGALEYVYIVIPTNFEHNTWITAGEIRPSDRSVVHHVSAFWRPAGSAWLKDAKPGVPYVIPKAQLNSADFKQTLNRGAAGAQPLQLESGAEFLIGYSPGMPVQDFSIGHAAKLIPAQADLVLELHFTPNGKTPVEERIETGFVLAKTDPVRRFLTISNWSWNISIPPGDANHEGHASMRFNEAVDLVFMQPHMHLRGKDMELRVIYPTGETQTLFKGKFDFDWQLGYTFAKPIPLPKGTRVLAISHFDNSANNKFNPDPSKEVRWGLQNWDEMSNAFVGLIFGVNDDPTKLFRRSGPSLLPAGPAGPTLAALQASR